MELWGGGVTGAGRWLKIYLTTERLSDFFFFFEQQLRLKKTQNVSDVIIRLSPVIGSYLDDALPPLRLIQKSEIICVTRPHTHTHTHTAVLVTVQYP